VIEAVRIFVDALAERDVDLGTSSSSEATRDLVVYTRVHEED
jgi:hypothetical protein